MFWDIVLAIVFLFVGFVMLVKGADWFVDGAAGLAAKLRIPQLVIGLTVVAFGTSAPELATSVISAVKQDVGIAIGNVLGSNITNILLILGLSALFTALPVQKDSLKIDLPVLLGSSALIAVFGVTGNEIERWEGLIMVAVLVGYTVFLIVNALKHRTDAPDLENHEIVEEDGVKKGFDAWYEKMKEYGWFLAVATVVGLAVVVGGAMLAVEGATTVAESLGVSQNVIGLTVVAIGTSLPELITSVTAARKGETDIAVGNVVGTFIIRKQSVERTELFRKLVGFRHLPRANTVRNAVGFFNFHVDPSDIMQNHRQKSDIVRKPHSGGISARFCNSFAQTAIHRAIKHVVFDK